MQMAVHPRLSALTAVHAVRAAIGVLVVVIAVLDVIFRGSHRGIMTLLVAVPGLGALLPARHRRPLVIGGIAFGTALLLGGLEWRDRPVVVAGTLVNIVLITFLTRRFAGPGTSQERPCTDQQGVAIPSAEAERREVSCRLGDVRVEMRTLPGAGQKQLRTVVYDLRPTPFGVRLLVVSFTDEGSATRTSAANLLHRWARIAHEQPGLADVARGLNELLASDGDDDGDDCGGAKSLLVGIKDDGDASVICCGHPPPLLVSENTAEPLNIMSPLPPLGRFARTGRDLPIYTTSVRLTPGRRLLLVTTDHAEDLPEAEDALPVRELESAALRDLEPGAFLDHVTAQIRERDVAPDRGEALLVLIERVPQGASSLLPAPENDHDAGTAAQEAPSTRT